MVSVIIYIGLLAIYITVIVGDIQSAVVAADSSFEASIDEPSSEIETVQGRRERRLAVNDLDCTLFEMTIETEDSIYSNDTQSQTDVDEWLCQLDKYTSREVLGLDDPLVRITGWSPDDISSKVASAQLVGRDRDDIDVGEMIESGKTTIRIRKGMIDRVDQTMTMDSEHVQVVRDEDYIRRLQSSDITPIVGTRRVVVVRFSTNDYSHEPQESGNEIRASVFKNARKKLSFRRQIFKCSFRKLKMLPYDGNTITNVDVNKGIVNLRFNVEQSDSVREIIEKGKINNLQLNRIMSYCRSAAEASLGDLESQFDHVMFVMPEGVNMLAAAIIGRWDSYYGSSWILRPSMPLHEVGHNLGLEHAGENETYDDKIGYMGFSYNKTKGPAMCFNPANSYYLGWYKDQTASYNAETSGDGKLFRLNGITDYKPSKAGIGDNRRIVVLRLTQTTRSWDFYVGYNRRTRFNIETEEDGNEIIILRKKGPAASTAETKKIGTISLKGSFFEIENYNGAGSVFITFEDKKNRGKDIIIKISTTRPTPAPSAYPSSLPTTSPSFNPTAAPTTSLVPTISSMPTTEGENSDREDFRYRNFKNRDCQWVSEKLERCSFVSQQKYVQTYWCRKTCAKQNWCLDDRTLRYGFNDDQNCSWVAESLNDRCDSIWMNKMVKDHWCPRTCNPGCDEPPANANIKVLRRRQGEDQ